MGVITVRLNERDFEDLKKIEREEKADRAMVTRKLLALAIKEWKKTKALKLLKERKITIRKAASFAEVSYVEMLDLISKASLDLGYTLTDIRSDMDN